MAYFDGGYFDSGYFDAGGGTTVESSFSANAVIVGATPVVAATTGSDTGNSTGHNITLPSSNVGDILLVLVAIDNDVTSGSSLPAGWSKQFETSDGEGYVHFAAWTRTVDGSEGSTVAITHSSSQACTARVLRLTGASAVEWWTAGGNNANPNPPSVTASWGSANNLWIAAYGLDGWLNYNSSPSGYTYIFNSRYPDSGEGTSMAAAYRAVAAATEDPGTFSTDSGRWAAATFAVAPLVAENPTVESSFSANAVIKGSGSGSLTANAVIKKTGSSSFAANSIARRSQSGSFTADARIWDGSAIGEGSWTADAVVLATITGSLSSAAVTKRTLSGSLAVDALIKRWQTGSIASDSVIRQTSSGALTTAALVRSAQSGSFTATAVVRGSTFGQVVADAWVSCWFTADAIVKATIFGSNLVFFDDFNRTIATGGGFGANYPTYYSTYSPTNAGVDGSAGYVLARGSYAAQGYPSVRGGFIQYDFWVGADTSDSNFYYGVDSSQPDYTFEPFEVSVFTAGDGEFIAEVYPTTPNVDFVFSPTPSTWYTVKGYADTTYGGGGFAAVKVWPRDLPEPEGWDLVGAMSHYASPGSWASGVWMWGFWSEPARIDNLRISTDSANTIFTADAIYGMVFGSFTANAIVSKTIHVPWVGINDEHVHYPLNSTTVVHNLVNDADEGVFNGTDKQLVSVSGPAAHPPQTQALYLNANTSRTTYADTYWANLERPSGEMFPAGSAPRTFSIWYSASDASSGDLFSYGSYVQSGVCFSISLWSGYIYLHYGASTYVYGVSSLNPNNGLWHHIAVTYDGSNVLQVYFDGVSRYSTNVGALNTSNSRGAIGRHVYYSNSSWTSYFKGALSTFKSFDRALSASEIATLYNWPSVPTPTAIFANAYIKKTNLQADAEIILIISGSFTAKAEIWPATYTHYGVIYPNAYVLGPWPGSFTADSQIIGGLITHGGTVTADAAISQTRRQGSLSVDSWVRATLSEAFIAAAVIVSAYVPPETGLPWIDTFTRTVTGGWGNGWTGNYMTNASVNGSQGVIPAGYATFPRNSTVPVVDEFILMLDFQTMDIGTGSGYETYISVELGDSGFDLWTNNSTTNPMEMEWEIWAGNEPIIINVLPLTWYTIKYMQTSDNHIYMKVWQTGTSEPGWQSIVEYYWDNTYTLWMEIDASAANPGLIDNFIVREVSGTWEYTLTLDAEIRDYVIRRGSLTADAISHRFFTADALIGRNTRSFTADAVIKRTWFFALQSATDGPPLLADAYVGTVLSGHLTLDAVLFGSHVFAFPPLIAWIVDGRTTRSFTADAWLGTYFFTMDAYIQPWFTADAFIRKDAIVYWDEDGNPVYDRSYQQQIEILVDGEDVTADVVVSETTFSQMARTGAGTFRLMLRGVRTDFHGGEIVYVNIDGFRQFGGLVMSIESSYWFEDKAEARTVLIGTDFNILFDKIYLYTHPPEIVSEAAVYPQGITDQELIWRVYEELLDLPAGFDYQTGVMNAADDVITVVSPDEKWQVNGGQSLRSFMSEVTKVTNAVFWIDPYLILQYHSRSAVSDRPKITDGQGGISSRDLEIRQDVSNMYNDVIVWGALAVSLDSIQDAYHVRYTDDAHIAAYGLHQFTEVRSDLHTTSHISKRARSIFNRRNLVLVTGSVTILEPYFQAGQVVEVSSKTHDWEGALVIHELQMRFPMSYESHDGKFYTTPVYDLQLGLQPDDPWNIYDMLPFDYDFTPHPFFGGNLLQTLTDPWCPLPVINGGSGGVMQVGWSSLDPSGGTRPWHRANLSGHYVWTSEYTPTIYYSGGTQIYPSSFPFWRMRPTGPAPYEAIFDFSMYYGDWADQRTTVASVVVGNNAGGTDGLLCSINSGGGIFRGWGTYPDYIPTMEGFGEPFDRYERVLLRILHTGTQTFVKLWHRYGPEPAAWDVIFDDPTPLAGDWIAIYPDGYQYDPQLWLFGITVTTGFTDIPDQYVDRSDIGMPDWDGPVDIEGYLSVYWSTTGWTYGWQFPNLWASDPPGYGWPYVGWDEPEGGTSYAEGHAVPQCALRLHSTQDGSTPGGIDTRCADFRQEAVGILLKKNSDNQFPLSIKIKGEILWTNKGDGRGSVIVGFGLGNKGLDPVASNNYYIPWNGILGYVTANQTTWTPFEFEWQVNMAYLESNGDYSYSPYLWIWPTMEPQTMASYMGRAWQASVMLPTANASYSNIQNLSVLYNYGPATGWPGQHFCIPAAEGPTLSVTETEPPIWGWHSEAIEINMATGDFTLAAKAAWDFMSVFVDGDHLIPHKDYEYVSGKIYRLSAEVLDRVITRVVMVNYLVLSTWLLMPTNVSRPVETNTYPDGNRMPDIRGHL